MKKNEIESVIKKCMDRYDMSLQPPVEKDWVQLEAFFGTRFCLDFQYFMELMIEYEFPGEIYNVTTNSEDDDIYSTYSHESTAESWDADLVPFHGLGNGDYFCLSKTEGEGSKVYFYDHASNSSSPEFLDFSAWVKNLPDYLN